MEFIPQCDPRASYLAQKVEIDEAVARALDGGRYILGPEVESFEQEFAAWNSARACVAVANGTQALEIALRASGVGPGDLVITVSNSAVATAVAVRTIGASPLFVDVEPTTGLMQTSDVESVLRLHAQGRLGDGPGRIGAIVPVHLYGLCADMPALVGIAQESGIPLVEDCAQAHGAAINGVKAGSWGVAGSFSFYPTKNLGAFGDGGAIAFRDLQIANRAKLLRQYGWESRYVSQVEGQNSRLDEIQAAILRIKLRRLTEANQRRIQIANMYLDGITNPVLTLPRHDQAYLHVYHQFVVQCVARNGLQSHLREAGIGSLVHYPVPIHLQPAYASPSFAPVPLKNTEAWSASVLSLPVFPELTDTQVNRVIDTINSWNP
jgi:dTDP-4-amino-4,6-dideoxygalactose transaminase